MKVLLFGASGMVGSGVLLECLDDPRVEAVTVVGRSPLGRTHSKLREIIHADFFSYDSLRPVFGAVDTCFFCLGVSSLGLKEPEYTKLTYDLTLAAARAMVAVNPGITFCYISGAGTDSSERGSTMWARVKGRTENALLRLGFGDAYMFRPGFIQPIEGARSRTGWIHAMYTVLGPVIVLIAALVRKRIVTTAILGRAMIQVAQTGFPKPVLEPPDILQAGQGHSLTTAPD